MWGGGIAAYVKDGSLLFVELIMHTLGAVFRLD